MEIDIAVDYRVDAQGRLVNLRAFWEQDVAMASGLRPLTDDDRRALKQHVRSTVEEVVADLSHHGVEETVAVGGTIRALARVMAAQLRRRMERLFSLAHQSALPQGRPVSWLHRRRR